ncbi:MAG TPA: universal stress protein [Holophagaceae bacterium]|nr:universal stress protein [Holophagaceae bacterium]
MFTSILVGLDFSPASLRALAEACELGRRLDLPVRALHVVEMPYPSYFPTYATLGDPAWFRTHEPKVQAKLDESLAPHPGVTSLIRQGNPAERLLMEATADTLIVIGHVGHSRWEHLLFGSTAASVARHAPGSVWIVRADRPAPS